MRTPLRFARAGLIAFGWTTASATELVHAVTTVFVAPPPATQQTPKLAAELAASAADLRKALQKQSSVRLVDTPERADVILSVHDRQWKTMVAGSESWGDDTHHQLPNYNTWARLTVEVRANGFSTSMVAHAKSWKGAASRAASDVAKWIDVNRRFVER